MKSQVAIRRTRPETVVEDYGRLMRLVKYDQLLARDQDLILKLNLSWTKYFPACSSQPWQVDDVLETLVDDGYDRKRLFPVENKTVVTNPVEGCRNNKWAPVLTRHGVPFIPLPDVEWIVYPFKSPLLKLNRIFPEGIEIPKMYVGKNVCHLPTQKVHGHTVTTGAIKNSFAGLLKELRHYAHEFIHERMAALMYTPREPHPTTFAADGVGAVRVERLPRPPLVSDRRPGAHPRVRGHAVGPPLRAVLRCPTPESAFASRRARPGISTWAASAPRSSTGSSRATTAGPSS